MVQFRHLVFGLGTLPNLVRYMEVVGWTRHLSLCLYTSLEHSTGSLFSTCLFLTLSWSFQLFVFCPFVFQVCVVTHLVHLHVWWALEAVAPSLAEYVVGRVCIPFLQTLLRMNVARHTSSLQLPFCHVLFVFGALPLSLVLGELVACWSCHSSVSAVCVSL